MNLDHLRSKLKIAIIGNMNNNHFSMMRYLTDFGYNVELLCFNNELEHFKPENDTWLFEKWVKKIKYLNIDSYGKSVFICSKKSIQKEFEGYDFYIGNGFTPGYFYYIGKKLDIFIPYSLYVEGLTFNTKNIFKRFVLSYLIRLQKKGLIHATDIAISTSPTTRNILLKYCNSVKKLNIPMVYNQELFDNRKIALTHEMEKLIHELKNYTTVVLSHVSHIWKNLPTFWKINLKSNHILIQGFAEYVRKTDKEVRLILFEYGYDVGASKELIAELGISSNVIWLPKLPRKEIMLLLNHVDFGCGELGGEMWGGTGWEFMAMSKPFFQYVNLTENQFHELMGANLPPIINANNPSIICDTLIDFEHNQQKYRQMGKELNNWFNRNGGVELAKKYDRLILDQAMKNVH